MKKLIYLAITLLLMVILPSNILASNTADAKELIDIDKKTSLTLKYEYENININNVNVRLYKVGDLTKDFQYTLTEKFGSYPIEINGIEYFDEWTALSETISSYVNADSISETESGIVNNNKVSFTNLETGLYLVVTDKIDEKKYILEFESFLITLPVLSENGTWNYNATALPKPSYYEPKNEEITYSVIKEWKDTGEDRPVSVSIDIYKDEELYENVTLSSENNWCYSWNYLDDGSKFSVVEREIPREYTVKIEKNNTRFIVVNTKEEINPKTLDNIYIYFILLSISFVGLASLVFTLKKSENNN